MLDSILKNGDETEIIILPPPKVGGGGQYLPLDIQDRGQAGQDRTGRQDKTGQLTGGTEQAM